MKTKSEDQTDRRRKSVRGRFVLGELGGTFALVSDQEKVRGKERKPYFKNRMMFYLLL